MHSKSQLCTSVNIHSTVSGSTRDKGNVYRTVTPSMHTSWITSHTHLGQDDSPLASCTPNPIFGSLKH